MESHQDKSYDLGIIGGGICGAAIARDAALRGISVVLFEKNEFGSGASSKSSKLIHGGIRYLELSWKALMRGNFSECWKNFRFVFLSLRESSILRRIAPTLVEPLPLWVPIYRSDKRNRWMIFSGAILYFLMGLVSGKTKMPALYIGKKSMLSVLPDLNPEGLIGGVRIWDHWVDDKKLVITTLASAQKNGAVCLEHAAVSSYSHEEASNYYSLRVTQAGHDNHYRVRKLVDASGPWVDKTRAMSHDKDKNYVLPVAGSHLELKAFLPGSVLLQAIDGRFFFVIQHGDKARVGTTERPVTDLERVGVTEEEVDYLLSSLKRYFPKKEFTRADIISKDAGVRPLSDPHSSLHPNEISREHEIRVSSSGCVHMIGVKLTDHRRAAEEVVDRIVPLLLSENPKLRRKTVTHREPLL